MSARGRGRRGPGAAHPPSGAWGRLKPVNIDPLESMGLPSKGDNRLLDFKTQERYHTKIVDRYMSFCSQAGRGDELLRRLDALNLGSPSADAVDTSAAAALSQNDLSTLMMALRKLREGIVASKRIDDFATQVYLFSIRLAILARHMESYQPAILHLLRRMHVIQPLSSLELYEVAGYLVLDLACRQQDLAGAYAARRLYHLRDAKVDAILDALAHDNFDLFWRVKRSVDGHKARLMEFAEETMKIHALKCLGRSYLVVDLAFLERATDTEWAKLVSNYHLGWELQGTKVIIRKPKAR